MSSRTSLAANRFGREGIQRWVDDILCRYEKNIGSIAPPIHERILCKVVEQVKGVKIAVIPESNRSMFDEGLLAPVRGGFILKYGTRDGDLISFPKVKMRETVCHELAHVLFYDCSCSVPSLESAPPEYICHDMARSMLLPERLVRERFYQKSEAGLALIQIVRELSREFQVAVMLVVKRLTEDLFLTKDTMVTLWRYRGGKGNLLGNEVAYGDYRVDSKVSPELGKLLPRYWRRLVHVEVWNEVISKVAIEEAVELPQRLHVGGQRAKKGRTKSIPFIVECEPLYVLPSNLLLGLKNKAKPISDILSVQRFDLAILEGG